MKPPQLILLPLLWMLFCATPAEFLDHNFLSNGDFSQGAGNTPSHWSTATLVSSASSTTFSRIRESGAAGELVISSIKRDTARRTQIVVLEPGWYRLTGEARTEGFDLRTRTTALIGISDPWQVYRWSPGKPGTSEWGAGRLYVQLVTTSRVEVVCLLSGSGGSVSLRHFRVTRVAGEPSASAQKVELDSLSAVTTSNRKEMLLKNYSLGMEHAKQQQELRRARRQIEERCRKNWHFVHFVPATGSYWTIVLTMLLLVAIPIFGWRALGETKPR